MYRQISNDTALCRKPKGGQNEEVSRRNDYPKKNRKQYRLAKPTGLEPVTSDVTGRCSDQIEL